MLFLFLRLHALRSYIWRRKKGRKFYVLGLMMDFLMDFVAVETVTKLKNSHRSLSPKKTLPLPQTFSSWQKLVPQVDWICLARCLCWSYRQWFYLPCPEVLDHHCATPQEASKDCAWWVGGTDGETCWCCLFRVGDSKALRSWSGTTFHKIRQLEEMLNSYIGNIFKWLRDYSEPTAPDMVNYPRTEELHHWDWKRPTEGVAVVIFLFHH